MVGVSWVLVIIIMPYVCFILALFLIFNYKKNKVVNNKNTNNKIKIVFIIFLLLPMLNNIITWAEKNSKYANVEKLDYVIEQISDWEFNVYFNDEENNYYIAQKIDYNLQSECEIYLVNLSKEKKLGLKINLLNERLEKVYMKDYKGNKVLVWDISDYDI